MGSGVSLAQTAAYAGCLPARSTWHTVTMPAPTYDVYTLLLCPGAGYGDDKCIRGFCRAYWIAATENLAV